MSRARPRLVQVARRTEASGFTFSYDMLGEAARTEADAKRYRAAYAEAIAVIASRCTAPRVRDNPGVSVKLSALHPRYEVSKRGRVMSELVERTLALAVMARETNGWRWPLFAWTYMTALGYTGALIAFQLGSVA